MKTKHYILLCIVLAVTSAMFLFVESVTHLEFMFHLAAIPLEILLAVFIVNRFLGNKEKEERRRKLMLIKSCLFRSEMRNLFITNFSALAYPSLTMAQIRNSTLDELRKVRKEADTVEYRSPEAMEPAIMEYVKAQHVWQNFMDLAITYDFKEVFQDTINILHFIHDVKQFKDDNPRTLFAYEAEKSELLMEKTKNVLGDGIRKFLDYAIELKEKQPELFCDVISDYKYVDQARTE